LPQWHNRKRRIWKWGKTIYVGDKNGMNENGNGLWGTKKE
jgi:hypothetical protein